MRFLLLLLIIATASPSDTPAQTPAILQPGISLGTRPDLKRGAAWLGLTKTPSGYVLLPATLTVADTSDPCGGSAVLISAGTSPAPDFLLLAPTLKPGPVRAAAATPLFLHPGENASLRVTSTIYYWLIAYGKAEPVPGNVVFTEYRLLVGHGQYADTLAFPNAFPDDGKPTIVWVGDLDRDDRPDFIADLTTHYEGHRWALFLSAPAGPPRLLAPVADRIEPGC